MLLTSPPVLQFKQLSLSTPFLNGTTTTTTRHLSKPSSATISAAPPQTFLPVIKAMRSIQGKVVCSSSDKTVAVEVTRLAPHPKYKRRIRSKKKYQAHDPLNQFSVGDIVELQKCRPISKNKSFLAVPVAPRKAKVTATEEQGTGIGIPLESEQTPVS